MPYLLKLKVQLNFCGVLERDGVILLEQSSVNHQRGYLNCFTVFMHRANILEKVGELLKSCLVSGCF